jgi:ABC-2 type transport system permease protein
VIGIPVVFLLLFVYVFDARLGVGLPDASGGRAAYVAFVTPGIVLLAIAGSAQGTAISMDMTEGIIARFRTMAISRASVLTGHVLGNTLQTLLGIAVVLGVALLVGFRPTTDPVAWLATVGPLTLVTVTWLCVATRTSRQRATYRYRSCLGPTDN